ncbi:MAG: flagellar basal body rod modification protein [Thiobacillus sp. 63-78]|uniref:flagellar hook assembly protein FlgD n=1 Tax=Thiobacillus sp. 63-78 TaxID=1895859 RepID=UPI000960A79E|nr:flagellar hook assembly protein FlgD [Thiobacillus sp. 63-78]MBN8763937.1 flagellar hook assembly protein FlgD [Thiobacillus sp.]MBN8773804.1 flagellar hook assembly protein FlgD [Thiobacillus sp.]OJZ04798.1 MAG: flagellar basal body rod modification protein [Thiobacillus sp. 63-78]
MSTVQDTTNASSLYGRSTSTVVKGSAEDTQNRFLSLLVAQMKNQDPLNPLDNAEVTSQMAQLSTVQGIENMNSSLQAMAASLGTNQMSQAASLIGRTVLVPGNTISPAQLDNVMGFELSRPADKVTAGVYDASGAQVRKLTLGSRDAGVNVVAWDGLTDAGTAAPAGRYSFKIDAVQGGQAVDSTTLNLGTVNSVSQNGQGVQLNLAGNTSVGYADVRQIF